MDRSQNIVRLLPSTPQPSKVRSAKENEGKRSVKLAVRFLTVLNAPLRTLTQYRGDLSSMVMDAVKSVDLVSIQLIDIRMEKEEETCLMLSEESMRALKKAAKQREVSLNVLINTAVAHWLAAQKAVKLKE